MPRRRPVPASTRMNSMPAQLSRRTPAPSAVRTAHAPRTTGPRAITVALTGAQRNHPMNPRQEAWAVLTEPL